MTSGQARLPVAPSMFKFAQHGKCGMWVSELLPHTAKFVDDIALVEDGPHQRDQPRPGLHVRDDRQRSPGQAERRLVAELRPGQREQRPAGVRRADAVLDVRAPRPRRSSRGCGRAVSCRASTAASRCGASATRCSTCRTPTGVSDANRRAMLDTLGAAQPADVREVRRPGDADADRAVRDGLPHADERAGTDRPVEGADARCSSCTARR